jgi:hypothetical protein
MFKYRENLSFVNQIAKKESSIDRISDEAIERICEFLNDESNKMLVTSKKNYHRFSQIIKNDELTTLVKAISNVNEIKLKNLSDIINHINRWKDFHFIQFCEKTIQNYKNPFNSLVFFYNIGPLLSPIRLKFLLRAIVKNNHILSLYLSGDFLNKLHAESYDSVCDEIATNKACSYLSFPSIDKLNEQRLLLLFNAMIENKHFSKMDLILEGLSKEKVSAYHKIVEEKNLIEKILSLPISERQKKKKELDKIYIPTEVLGLILKFLIPEVKKDSEEEKYYIKLFKNFSWYASQDINVLHAYLSLNLQNRNLFLKIEYGEQSQRKDIISSGKLVFPITEKAMIQFFNKILNSIENHSKVKKFFDTKLSKELLVPFPFNSDRLNFISN